MQTKFNIVLSSIHPVSISIPGLGEVNLPARSDFQLLNASPDTVTYLRNTFANTGITISLNKESNNPFRIHDYDEEEAKGNKKVVVEEPKKSPFEKAGDFVLPSGKHKGKKIKELDDNILRQISKMSKNQTVISTIDGYLIMKQVN